MKMLAFCLGWLLIAVGVVLFFGSFIAFVPAAFIFFISKIGLFGFAFLGIVIAFLGTQHKNPNVQRFACVLGLIGQPFWFWTTYQAEQWGLFFLCFVYLGIWLMGLKNNWFNRSKVLWTMAEPEDLLNMQHPDLAKRITKVLIKEVKPEQWCKFYDCGWCYHEDGPANGCPGIDKCPVNKEDEEGRPAESDEEHPQADAKAD